MDRVEMIESKERGFTLVELMVGSVIFLVGILSLGTLQINAIKTNSMARHMTEASTLASDRIERLMTETWSKTHTGTDLLVGNHSEKQGNCTVVWEVTDSSDGRSKTLDIQVSWIEEGRPHRVAYTAVRTLN